MKDFRLIPFLVEEAKEALWVFFLPLIGLFGLLTAAIDGRTSAEIYTSRAGREATRLRRTSR